MISSAEILNARILIVDDQEINILLLDQILRSVGYVSISSTMYPGEVCKLHRKNRYGLILLDIHMPGMDGFQVMESLKEIEKDSYLPVIVITSHPNHKLRALAAGANDFISKPFDLLEVSTRIHNMLEVRLLYTQLEDANRLMESLALHDALTGLPNRRLLMDRIPLAIAHARRSNGSMAVMCLDLDGFKQINDTLGHDAGDTLLNMIAARLVTTVRQEDTVARLGGDEFVFVLWELSRADDAVKLASKVMQAVSQPYSVHGRNVNVTASIGIGIYPTHGEDMGALMKSTDLAMYEAKRTGKNNFCIASR